MSIRNIHATGASAQTAGQDRLSAGIGGSEAMAKRDGQFIQQYKPLINSVGNELGVEPALIAGIISRESRGGTAIEHTGGWGDHHNAFGLMQIDKRWHRPQGGWNSREHIYQATSILCDFIKSSNNPFSDPNQRLKAGIAAYNMGFSHMSRNYSNIDDHTTGRDYSNDVVARAQFFQGIGY